MLVFEEAFAERLLVALDNSHIGVAICDDHYRFRAISRTLAGMNGLPPEAHLGKTIHDVLGPVARVIEPVMSRVITKRKPIIGVELEAHLPRTKDLGHWIEDYVPVVDDGGEVTRVCALVVDVTKERRLERSLQILRSRALRKLILTASHAHTLMERCMRGLQRSRQLRVSQKSYLLGLNETLVRLQRTLTESIAAIAASERLENRSNKSMEDHKTLSQREREIVRFLSQGKSNKEAASLLGISVKTVETHRARSMNKLGLTSLAELVHYAIRQGIVEA